LPQLKSLANKRGIDFTVGQPGLQRFLVEKLVKSMTDSELTEFSAQAIEQNRMRPEALSGLIQQVGK
jgi:hypothetical protein